MAVFENRAKATPLWAKIIFLLVLGIGGLTWYQGMWTFRGAKQKAKKQLHKAADKIEKKAGVTSSIKGTSSSAKICRDNLSQIEGAKREILQNNDFSKLSTEQIKQYFKKKKREMPSCPNGGTYNINSVGVVPTCTVGSNNTPKPEDDHNIQGH